MTVKTKAINVDSLGRHKQFYDTQSVANDIHTRTALALRLMLEDLHQKSIPNTPRRHGGLRTSVSKQYLGHNKAFIEWKVEYAEYQERGWITNPRTGERIVFKNYTTPGTGPHYAENAVDSVMENFRTYFLAGGVI